LFLTKYILLLLALLLTACAQKERAGDITLATSPTNISNVSQTAVNSRNQNADSSSGVIAGTNLTSDYAGAVSSGVRDTAAQGGLRIPGATATPVAVPTIIPSSESVTGSPASASESVSTQSSNSSNHTPNASSSTLVEGSKIPVRSITIVRTKPDCSSADCPTIKVKRLSLRVETDLITFSIRLLPQWLKLTHQTMLRLKA